MKHRQQYNLSSPGREDQSSTELEMYFAKKAALRLDEHRMALQRQHKSLLADLAKNSDQTSLAQLFEAIESVRLALKQSIIESIMTSRNLTKRMDLLNFGSLAEAFLAQGRLDEVVSDVTKTLNELDKSAAQKGLKEPRRRPS